MGTKERLKTCPQSTDRIQITSQATFVSLKQSEFSISYLQNIRLKELIQWSNDKYEDALWTGKRYLAMCDHRYQHRTEMKAQVAFWLPVLFFKFKVNLL